MRILYVGSKTLGASALELLHRQGAQICAVVARSDDPSSEMWYRSVTAVAQKLALPVLKPKDINSNEFIETVKAIQPERILTVFHPQIFKQPLLSIAPRGNLNLHFAPLPRYRGCYPGAWAIINGEYRHGVTLHHMDSGVDSGAIAFQEDVEIESEETGRSLYEKCEQAGLDLLRRYLHEILEDDPPSLPQQQEHALYYPRGIPYAGIINWGWGATFIERFIRALTFPPFRNPITFVGAHRLVLERVSIESQESATGAIPGEVLTVDPLRIQCGLGTLVIDDYKVVSPRDLQWTPLVPGRKLGQ